MPITKEQIDELVELTTQIPEGPYFAGFDDGRDCPNHANSGLAVVDTGRESEWPIARHCHWPVAKWIVLSRAAMPALIETLAEADAQLEVAHREIQQANERVAELEQVMREVLSGFPPKEMLDELDDPEQTGIRPWPMKSPTMATVRHWHEVVEVKSK